MTATFNNIMNRYECEFTNNKGERVLLWINKTKHDRKFKRGLMNLWIKAGYMKKFIPETWNIDTYVYDSEGNCRRKYNPQITADGRKINFEWMIEATPENLQKIISEVERRANG